MEELEGIDASTIDELCQIKEDQQVLADRLEKMGEKRSSTTPAVYQRVERDYAARRRALEDRAKPLKEAARREFAKLEQLTKRVEQALEVVRLDKEELEFRNAIGEYDQKTYAEGAKTIEAKIEERQAELRACEEVRGRFIAAFPSEDDLRKPAPPASPSPTPAATAEAAATAGDSGAAAPQTSASEGQPPEPPEPPPAPAPTAVVAAAPPPAAGLEGSATRVMPQARLILAKDDGSTEEFRLGAQTLIGRSPEAQVRLNAAAVSRKHSQVVVTPDGFKLVDLGSENGTYVNGTRVQERLLENGDRVQIGMARFVYRA